MVLAKRSKFRESLSMTERPSMEFRVFGLTGGVASGKSCVAARLRELGVEVVDADEVARDVVRPGTSGLAEIATSFGDVLNVDGALDRKKLGQLVFGDEAARRRLEAIIHPRIAVETARRIAELEARFVPLVCYDAALLVEMGRYESFRPLVVVAVPREVQRARLMRRDSIDSSEADVRIGAQLPLESKVAVADFVIDNQGTLQELRREVDRVLSGVRTWARRG